MESHVDWLKFIIWLKEKSSAYKSWVFQGKRRSCIWLPVLKSYLMWTAGGSLHCSTLKWKRWIKTSPLPMKDKKPKAIIIKSLWQQDRVLQATKRLENVKCRPIQYSQHSIRCCALNQVRENILQNKMYKYNTILSTHTCGIHIFF